MIVTRLFRAADFILEGEHHILTFDYLYSSHSGENIPLYWNAQLFMTLRITRTKIAQALALRPQLSVRALMAPVTSRHHRP